MVDYLKNYFHMKFKLLNLLLIASFIFSACSKTGTNEGSFTSGPNWTLTLDGKKYSWSGPFPATVSNNGQASYVGTFGISPAANIVLNSISVAGLAPQMITIQLSNTATGTFSMTPDMSKPGTMGQPTNLLALSYNPHRIAQSAKLMEKAWTFTTTVFFGIVSLIL